MRFPETILLLCVFCGLLIYLFPLQDSRKTLDESFSDSLVAFLKENPSSNAKIAISWNVCLDLIVKAVPLFNELGFRRLESGSPRDLEEVTTMQDVLELFSFYHRQGSAVERHVADQGVFEKLTNTSKSLVGAQYFIGGNAALMANGMAVRGSTVLLGGPVGPGSRPFLLPSVQVPPTNKEWDDEIHLILEFPKGVEWNGVASPRANRVILTHDVNNIETAEVMKTFSTAAREFAPDVMVATGFHMLGSQPSEFRQAQITRALATYEAVLEGRPVPIHVELASMGSLAFWRQLLGLVLPKVHSIGLNEQELYSTYQALGGKDFEYKDFTSPTPHLIMSTIGYVFNAAGSDTLQRVHFHCLQYHVVALSSRVKATLFPHSRGGPSAAIGSFATTTNACPAHDSQGALFPSPEISRLHLTDTITAPSHLPSPANGALPPARPLTANFAVEPFFFTEVEGVSFWVAPVMVCDSPKKTVGLGDSISSAGMAYSV